MSSRRYPYPTGSTGSLCAVSNRLGNTAVGWAHNPAGKLDWKRKRGGFEPWGTSPTEAACLVAPRHSYLFASWSQPHALDMGISAIAILKTGAWELVEANGIEPSACRVQGSQAMPQRPKDGQGPVREKAAHKTVGA